MPKHTFPFQTFFFVHGKIKRHLIFTLSFFSWVSLRTRPFLKKFIFVLTWTVSPILIFFFVVVHGKIKRHWYLPWVFFSWVSLRTRRVLKKLIFVFTWTLSPTLIHESAKFSSSMRQIPTKSRKSVNRYHANPSEDATIRPDMPQSSLERHRSQANFSEYVQKYRQYLFKRYIRPVALAWPKTRLWSPSTLL